jgi:hypothetical protein
MTVYEKLPGWLKAAIGIGVLLIGPVMVCSLWIWGVQGGITAFVSILVYFMILYVVSIRRYIESK